MDHHNGRSRISIEGHWLQWHVLIGAVVLAAVAYKVFSADDPGPSSVTVTGITASHPAFGTYPGLRVPLPSRSNSVNQHPI